MAEFKKQIGVGVAIAIVAAVLVGFIALYAFPLSPATSGPSGTPSAELQASSPFYAKNASCSLDLGNCTFTIVNNSTVPLALVACQMYVIGSNVAVGSAANGTLRSNVTWVTGTIGGTALNRIPASSQVGASCTVPTSALAYESNGSLANGGYTIEFLQNWNSAYLSGWGRYYLAGDEINLGFQGVWS